jgi:hypothetical protein
MRIHVAPENQRTVLVVIVTGFLVVSGICFYIGERRLGFIFLGMLIWMFTLPWLFIWAGYPVLWW